jgi:hypothetical protein
MKEGMCFVLSSAPGTVTVLQEILWNARIKDALRIALWTGNPTFSPLVSK